MPAWLADRTRRFEHLQADTVGLALVVAREVELALDGARGAESRGRRRRVRAGSRCQYGDRQCCDRDDLVLVLLGDHAGDVPLRDVRNLVRQHPGNLRLALRGEQQARVHPDIAAGQRKRVDLVVAYEKEIEFLPGIAALGHQPIAQRIDVVGRLHVVVILRIDADLPHDPVPEVALEQRRKGRLRHVSELGQAFGPRGGADEDGNNGETAENHDVI
jgi:hypothetical protein